MAESKQIEDIHNQYFLAGQNGLDVIFIVDPLNGLNRREFAALPKDWAPCFANPDVRAAMMNYALRIVRDFHPRYLGLASEINTYMESYPEDAASFVSLYSEIYDAVKKESPETQLFVTFQWEEINNLIPGIGIEPELSEIDWDQIEAFEPKLDLWVISSYPFVSFESAADIPDDYYSSILQKTSKPIAVAEGGYPTKRKGTEQDQMDYLNSIDQQLGSRLKFWIYLILSDFDIKSYGAMMLLHGSVKDVGTLNWFSTVGLLDINGNPKPALKVWDEIRNSE